MFPARVLWPIGLALLLAILLALLGHSLGAWDPTKPIVAAALLAAVGTVSAACIAALIWEYKARLDQEAKQIEDARQRKERVLDTILALQADIESDIEQLRIFNAQRELKLQDLDQRIDAEEKYALPRGVQSSKGLVLAAIEKDITIIPRPLIKPIINYYERDIDMGLMIMAFTEGKFDNLTPKRQSEYGKGYYSLGPDAQSAAEKALTAITEWLKGSNGSTVSTVE